MISNQDQAGFQVLMKKRNEKEKREGKTIYWLQSSKDSVYEILQWLRFLCSVPLCPQLLTCAPLCYQAEHPINLQAPQFAFFANAPRLLWLKQNTTPWMTLLVLYESLHLQFIRLSNNTTTMVHIPYNNFLSILSAKACPPIFPLCLPNWSNSPPTPGTTTRSRMPIKPGPGLSHFHGNPPLH